jgi:hypothetical protein
MKTVLCLALAICMTGCTDAGSDTQARTELAQLKTQLTALQSRTEAAEKQTANLNREMFQLQLAQQRYSSAEFDPVTSEGFQVADLGVGRVMVSIEDVAAFADGSRVTLSIGNPNAATFVGVDAEVVYGPSVSTVKKAEDYKAWNDAQKTVKTSILDKLTPGRWNKVTMNLPGVAPTQLGRMVVTLSGSKVELYK